MAEEADGEDMTFFEYIATVAEERDISRDSVEYAKLIEEKKPLYIATRDSFDQEERRLLAIWDIGKIIQHVCEQYESNYEATMEDLEEKDTDSLIFEPEEIAEFNARYTVGDLVLLAYTLAYECVTDLCEELARENELGTEEKSISQMSKKQVTERLYEEDIINDQLKRHIEHVVNRRNELTHEIEQRYLLSNFDDDLIRDTAHPLHAVDELFEIRFGSHAYIPAAEMDDLEP